ncbi:MAG: ABC transporter ATP-binding protein, partial [Eubacterium sp.]
MHEKQQNNDKQVFKWLYQNASGELLSCGLLLLANIGLSCMGVAFALASKSVIDGALTGGAAVMMK